MSGAGWEGDTCPLQESHVETLAEGQGTELCLHNLIFSGYTQMYLPEAGSGRSTDAPADGRSMCELSCQAGCGQQRTSAGTGFYPSTGLLTTTKTAVAEV